MFILGEMACHSRSRSRSHSHSHSHSHSQPEPEPEEFIYSENRSHRGHRSGSARDGAAHAQDGTGAPAGSLPALRHTAATARVLHPRPTRS